MKLTEMNEHGCGGGFTVNADLSVEGIARVHGPNIANWDDTNIWEYTFLDYETLNLWENSMVRKISLY